MHKSSMLRMKWFVENYLADIGESIVLDIGSYSVNRHDTYRRLFNKHKYIGVDISDGPNVDIALASPYVWNEIYDNYCDVLISGQTFEHIEFPWITMEQITRVVKPGGLICIIAPSCSRNHRYPVDCYRYFDDGMVALAKYAGLEIIHVSTDLAPKKAHVDWYLGADTMLIARKPMNFLHKKIDLLNYKLEPSDLSNLNSGFLSIKQLHGIRKFRAYLRKVSFIRKLRSLGKKLIILISPKIFERFFGIK